MAGEIISNRDFLKSITAAVLLMALTLAGMAEMTGYQTTFAGISVGGNLMGPSGGAASASNQAESATSTVGDAGDGSTSYIDTSQDPVVTGVQGGSRPNPVIPSVEISARAVNNQLSLQAASTTGGTVPESLGDLTFIRNDASTFTVAAAGIPGVAYVLEGTFDLRQWQPLARNYPDAEQVTFEVTRGSIIHTGFLRVRALIPASAQSVSVGPLIDTRQEVVVTGVVGVGSN